jgi:type IV secretory pathway VirB10-like protein
MSKKTKGIKVRNKVIDIAKADRIVSQTDYTAVASKISPEPVIPSTASTKPAANVPEPEPTKEEAPVIAKSKPATKETKYPWETAIPEQKSNILVQLDGVTYAKLKYLKEKLPNFSLRKFAIRTVTEQTEKLIDKTLKEEINN